MKKKINVLHLLVSLNLGGTETMIFKLIQDKSLDDKVNCTLVVLKDIINEELKKDLDGIKNRKIYIFDKKDFKSPKTLFKLLKIIIKDKIDVIHSHGDKWSFFCKVLMPWIKLVRTTHATTVVKNYNNLWLFLIKNIVDMNTAISESVLDEFRDKYVNNVVKVYNGININKFSQQKTKAKSNTDTLKIVNVGRLMLPNKGQDILLKALDKCKQNGLKFTCDFIGGTYNKSSKEILDNLVKEKNLEKEVEFLGEQYYIEKLLQNYDIFILPSRQEGLGLVILEAMASKVPVIASNIDGPAELIKHEENGLLFESENHRDLAEKILYFYNNKEKMQILAENAYNFVQEFDISNMAKNYYELYKNLIRNG